MVRNVPQVEPHLLKPGSDTTVCPAASGSSWQADTASIGPAVSMQGSFHFAGGNRGGGSDAAAPLSHFTAPLARWGKAS